MNRNYQSGYELKIDQNVFKVINVAGEGASSTVYLARKEDDDALHIIKEYNPKNVTIIKDDQGIFDVSLLDNVSLEKFNSGKLRFIEGAKKQVQIRNNYLDMMNNTFIVNWIKEANNTVYIDMSTFDGKSYDKIQPEKTLQELLVRIKAITMAVKSYHDNGFLHLDIKPANIFVLRNANDLVMLFDFDSVIEKSALNDRATTLSYSLYWAAPELVNYRYRMEISEKSDIFAIGEILYYRLFHKHSSLKDRRVFSTYDFSESCYAELCNLKLQALVEVMLRKTICNNPKHRIASCSDLLELLTSLIELAGPKEVYLRSTNVSSVKKFAGRSDEINEIERLIARNPVVCITGMGGIGKSALARRYAVVNKESIGNILYISFVDSWKTIVNVGIASCLVNYEVDTSLDEEKLFENVIQTFGKLVTEDTLVIIDNVNENGFFSERENYYRNTLLSLPGKYLLTTRTANTPYPSIQIGAMKKDELEKLFLQLLGVKTPDYDLLYIDKIIDYYKGHTLAIELIARQIYNEFSTPKEKFEQLIEIGLQGTNVLVNVEKDNIGSEKTPYEHVCGLFNLADLTQNQIHILAVLGLLPVQGLPGRTLLSADNDIDSNDLLKLVKLGWLDRVNDSISEHPLIQEVVNGMVGASSNYEKFLKAFKNNYLGYLSGSIIKSMLYIDYIINILHKLQKKEEYIADFLVPNGDRIEYSLDKALTEAKEAEELYIELNSDIAKLISVKCQYAAVASEKGNPEDAIRIIEGLIKYFPLDDADNSNYYYGVVNNALGVAYFLSGEIKKAASCFMDAIPYLEKTNERGYDELDQIYNNLGVYYGTIGAHEKAVESYLNAIEYSKKGSAEEEDEAFFYENIATSFYALEDIEKANEYVDKSLEMRKRIWGENSKPYASTLMKKASYLVDEKNCAGISDMLERIKKIYLNYFGEISFDTAQMYSSVAEIYHKCNDSAMAIQSYESANSIYSSMHGNYARLIVDNLLRMATIYCEQEDAISLKRTINLCKEKMHSVNDSEWQKKIKFRIKELISAKKRR